MHILTKNSNYANGTKFREEHQFSSGESFASYEETYGNKIGL